MSKAEELFRQEAFHTLKEYAVQLEREIADLKAELAVSKLAVQMTVPWEKAILADAKELHAKDSVRTKEHNLLVRENRTLRDGLTLIANGGEAADSIARLTLREATQPLSP